jgi:hypothetical protein
MIGDAGKGNTIAVGYTFGAHCIFPAFSPNFITKGWLAQTLMNFNSY